MNLMPLLNFAIAMLKCDRVCDRVFVLVCVTIVMCVKLFRASAAAKMLALLTSRNVKAILPISLARAHIYDTAKALK